jgi:hypothetical protein
MSGEPWKIHGRFVDLKQRLLHSTQLTSLPSNQLLSESSTPRKQNYHVESTRIFVPWLAQITRSHTSLFISTPRLAPMNTQMF